MKTYVKNGDITHEVVACNEKGFVTRCATWVPRTAVYVKVETKHGQQVPTRGFPCAACFEPTKTSAR